MSRAISWNEIPLHFAFPNDSHALGSQSDCSGRKRRGGVSDERRSIGPPRHVATSQGGGPESGGVRLGGVVSRSPSRRSGVLRGAGSAMPGCDGLKLRNVLSESDDPLPVIFLTWHGGVPRSVLSTGRWHRTGNHGIAGENRNLPERTIPDPLSHSQFQYSYSCFDDHAGLKHRPYRPRGGRKLQPHHGAAADRIRLRCPDLFL